jgi:hypothetical protein
MEINGNITYPILQRFGFGSIRAIEKNAALIKSPQLKTPSPERSEQSYHLMDHAMRIRQAIAAVLPFMEGARSVAVVSAARAESADDLELVVNETPTTLNSTEEVNSTATSISTFGPEVTGSTAEVTVGGTYNGRNGTQTLTFKAVDGGTHGQDQIDIRVYNKNNSQIGRILIRSTDAIDQTYTLNNGLVLSFGEGEILTGDTFTVDVHKNPNTFTPTEPEWTGTTPGLVTLGGVYDGSNGTGALTFQVDSGGTHGVNDLRISAYTADNTLIGQLDIRAADPLNQAYTLSNGITLQLGQGSLLAGSTFSVNVFDSIGSAVDPNKAFNGVRTDDPNLQQGYDVVAGSFNINGVEIAVNADDTINTILDRISQSDAGVTATFDAATEKVLLTQKTNGSTQGIVLGSDTSGFLAAVKLAGAAAAPGQDSEATSPLAAVARFASVQSGTISVNGIGVSIDVETDSLNDVLDRISNAGAGVVAAYDSDSGRVSVLSENQDQQLILGSGATSFFPAVEISDGTYDSEEALVEGAGAVDAVSTSDFMTEYINTFSTDGSSGKSGGSTADAPDAKILGILVKVVAGSLNAMFDDSAFSSPPSAVTAAVRQDIHDAVTAWRDSEGPRFKSDFGIRLDIDDQGKHLFDFSVDNQRLFEAAISNPEGRSAVRQGLFGSDPAGLFTQLHAALTSAASRLQIDVGTTGVFLDAFV